MEYKLYNTTDRIINMAASKTELSQFKDDVNKYMETNDSRINEFDKRIDDEIGCVDRQLEWILADLRSIKDQQFLNEVQLNAMRSDMKLIFIGSYVCMAVFIIYFVSKIIRNL